MQPNDVTPQGAPQSQGVEPTTVPEPVETPVVEYGTPAFSEETPSSDEVQSQQVGQSELPQIQPVQWQAEEYIQHDKSPLWYIGFIIVIIVLMITATLLMQTWSFAILIPVMAVALIVYSHRPPRQLNYVLSPKGIYINNQLHPLGEFKSFGVILEPQHNTLVLVPVKRFRPGLSIFFPTEVGESVVDLLGGYLPMRDEQPDIFDKIVRKLRL